MMEAAEIEIIVRGSGALSVAERSAVIEMVIEGGEVAGLGLEANLTNAKAVLLLKRGDAFLGCAALKHPQASYRAKIIKKSGLALDEAAFPLELGYFFIREAARGLRQSSRLVDAALAYIDGPGVFATVRADNVPMQRALAKAGFETTATYPGRNDQAITLLVRPILQS